MSCVINVRNRPRQLFDKRATRLGELKRPILKIVPLGIIVGWHFGVLNFDHSNLFRYSIFGFGIFYSYLSAATGSRREAVQAGANPENKPVIIETIMLTITSASEK